MKKTKKKHVITGYMIITKDLDFVLNVVLKNIHYFHIKKL